MSGKLLNRHEIEAEVASGQLRVEPFDPTHFRPASYVLCLGRRFRRWQACEVPIRLWSERAADGRLAEPVECDEIVIDPGEFMLASTSESVGLSVDRWALISPLSHIARFGLSIHCGADFVSPGFGMARAAPLTLELCNHNSSPLALTAGMPIAHLRIGQVDGSGAPPASIYERIDPLTPSRFFEDMSGTYLLRRPL